jgi:peptidoglycan/xylan/chitin deacetylase (PgdA/CDA1 family)
MAAPAGNLEVQQLRLAATLGSMEERRATWWAWVRELSSYSCELRRSVVQEIRAKAGLARDPLASLDEPQRRRFGLLNSDGVRQLVRAGMTVGAHTLSHPVLANAPRDEAWKEIQQGRAALHAVTGTDVWALAYPFGDLAAVGVREFEMAKQAGYECAFMNCGGGLAASFARFAIPRVHVAADMTLGEFEAHVSGFHEKLRQRFGRQGVVA